MGAPLQRLAGSVLAAVVTGASLTACAGHAHPAPSTSGVVRPVNALSPALSGRQRQLVLNVARDTATTTRPQSRPAVTPQTWSGNVTRVVAAVGSLADAAAWKRPGTSWQLSNPREANHPVLVVQMFGDFRFFRLRSRERANQFPGVVKYDVPELTYVISTFDGAHLSAVQGNSLPELARAGPVFAR